MKTYLITDTHFGHDNIIRYCNRPEDHETRILDSVRKIEGPGLLIHLGDVAFKKASYWNNEFIRAIPDKIIPILVKGNHDYSSDDWYYNHGWKLVCESLVIKTEGIPVLLTHIPANRMVGTSFNIHGHLHDKEPIPVTEEGIRYDFEYHKKLAIEEVDYRPVLISEFLKI